MSNWQTPSEEELPPPSKSALKREMEELRKKVISLVDLSEKNLSEIPLSDELREGILLARKLKKNDARRRQIQYMTKLMKLGDMTEIDNALEKLQQGHRNFQQRFHKIEQWRDQLVQNGDSSVNELLVSHPELDRQHLRQLVRQAQREAHQKKPPAASRKLFKYLQETIK